MPEPTLPEPVKDVGIPQYPTPLVPLFGASPNGHIILIVKKSVKLGAYTPLPVDGSVVYSGRDAKKWPTKLYLVYEKPDETGLYVDQYYANDRTTASQDAWNFAFTYSSENPAFPIVSRVYIIRRSKYGTAGFPPYALGAADPILGGSVILSHQEKKELPDEHPLRSLYVAVQVTYETIPGPVLTGEKYDDRGDLETVTVQTVVAGTSPTADGLLVSETSVEPVDSVKSTKKYGSVTSRTSLSSPANKPGLLGITLSTDDIVSPGTAADALSTTVLESSVEQLTATKARKRTTTSSGPSELDGKTLEEFGPANTTEKIVAYGSSPSSSDVLTLMDRVSPIDLAKSKEESLILTANNTLTGTTYDENLGVNITTTRQLIAAGTSAYTPVNGDLIYRDDPKNYRQTIRTIGFITGRPSPPIPTRTSYKTGAYTSPNLITGFYMPPPLEFPGGSQQGDVQLSITPVMRAARSFNTAFKLVESFSYGQPSQPNPALFDPLSINVYFDGFFIKVNIPNCLVDSGLSLSFTTASDNPVYGYCGETFNVPSTVLTASGYIALIGTYQIISYDVEYWKANIWKTTIRSVLIK